MHKANYRNILHDMVDLKETFVISVGTNGSRLRVFQLANGFKEEHTKVCYFLAKEFHCFSNILLTLRNLLLN